MSRLVQDLITDILLCLPVNALLRFRCLSKPLCHEIDSAAFTRAHLNRSIQTKTNRKLVFLDQDHDFSAIDFADELISTPTKLCNALEYKEGHSNRTLYHRGSCNGLLLLSSFDEFFVEYGLWLWNPFTRKSNKLPDYPGITRSDLPIFGFGYDPLSNDYKIVQIHGWQCALEICIFSMGSNTWRKLPLSIPFQTFYGILWDAVFVDGALHWLSHISENESIEIVSFDISKERFVDLIPAIPSNIVFPTEFNISLEVLQGILVYCQRDPTSQHVELFYAIKKDGQQIAWTKLYNLDLSCLKWDIGSKIFDESDDGNKIMLLTITSSDANFFWYDLKQRALEGVNIPQVPLRLACDGYFGYQIASFCWESLVSPNAQHQNKLRRGKSSSINNDRRSLNDNEELSLIGVSNSYVFGKNHQCLPTAFLYAPPISAEPGLPSNDPSTLVFHDLRGRWNPRYYSNSTIDRGVKGQILNIKKKDNNSKIHLRKLYLEPPSKSNANEITNLLNRHQSVVENHLIA